MKIAKQALRITIVTAATIALLVGLTLMFVCREPDVADLSEAGSHLRQLIEAEDLHYQRTGVFVPITATAEDSASRKQLQWCEHSCGHCDYGVSVSGAAYTAEVRCRLEKGPFNYLGYVRTAPGQLQGIDGPFGKCRAAGIFAQSRSLTNDVGPCYENAWKTMSVVSGQKKVLAITTLPQDTEITVDGHALGHTAAFRNTITARYGYYYLENPGDKPVSVTVSSKGFAPVTFTADWGSYTYMANIILRPE